MLAGCDTCKSSTISRVASQVLEHGRQAHHHAMCIVLMGTPRMVVSLSVNQGWSAVRSATHASMRTAATIHPAARRDLQCTGKYA